MLGSDSKGKTSVVIVDGSLGKGAKAVEQVLAASEQISICNNLTGIAVFNVDRRNTSPVQWSCQFSDL